MIHGLVVALIVSTPIRLAAPTFSAKGIEQKDAEFYLDTFTQELRSDELNVVTASDIATIVGIERQRQLMGCDDQGASCLAELANALGVEGVVRASVALIQGTYLVNIKVLKAGDASSLASLSLSATSELQLIADLKQGAVDLREQLITKLRPGRASGPISKRWFAVAPLAVGIGGFAAGGAFLASAGTRSKALRDGNITLITGSAQDYAGVAKSEQTAGAVFVGVGAAGVAAAVVTFLLLGPTAVQPVAMVTPQGASFGVAGALP